MLLMMTMMVRTMMMVMKMNSITQKAMSFDAMTVVMMIVKWLCR